MNNMKKRKRVKAEERIKGCCTELRKKLRVSFEWSERTQVGFEGTALLRRLLFHPGQGLGHEGGLSGVTPPILTYLNYLYALNSSIG